MIFERLGFLLIDHKIKNNVHHSIDYPYSVMCIKQVIHKSQKRYWNDKNVSEMKTFSSIIMYMGVVNLPAIANNWWQEIIYKNKFCPILMHCNLFQTLLSMCHLASQNWVASDCLWKLRSLLQKWENNLTKANFMGKAVVDKPMIQFPGWLIFRQNNPEKIHWYMINFLSFWS